MALNADLSPAFHPDALKRRLKELQKESNDVFQNWQIRLHRSHSWFKRAIELPDEQPDVQFMLLWVAFNALYSYWDIKENFPAKDGDSRRDFVRRLVKMDEGQVRNFLHTRKALLKKLLGNMYLSNIFWQNPKSAAAQREAIDDLYHLDRAFNKNEIARLLREVTDRLYVMRGQLMHGAATGGSKLNRTTLAACRDLLAHLVPFAIYLTLEHGMGDDWPDLCYPPIKSL